MRIHVKDALAELEELNIELFESKPTLWKTMLYFEVVSAIVYEYAVRKKHILPCTFTIKKPDGEYFITESSFYKKTLHYESGEKPMIVEINNPRNSHLIKYVEIPDNNIPEVLNLLKNPQNVDVLIKLLRGVNEIVLGICFDEKMIDQLNLVVAESLTLNRLRILGVTETGATPLIKMLTENTKLNYFEIADISCSNEQVKADLFTQLINALENNLSFKDFDILKDYNPEFHYLALEAKLRKSARLAYLQFCLRNQRPPIQAIHEHLSSLLIIPLIQIIYEYLFSDDLLASVDLNSAFMYYLMPQVPWKKQNNQGVFYTLDFSSEKELLDFHDVFSSKLRSLDSVIKGNLNSVERCLIDKRVAEAETLGFAKYYQYYPDIKKEFGFPNRIYLEIPVQLWICIFAIGEKFLEQFQKISIPVSKSMTYDQFIVCSQSKKRKHEQEQRQAIIKN